MVVLRVKRMCRRHRPFYRLNAIDQRSPRDGRVIEIRRVSRHRHLLAKTGPGRIGQKFRHDACLQECILARDGEKSMRMPNPQRSFFAGAWRRMNSAAIS